MTADDSESSAPGAIARWEKAADAPLFARSPTRPERRHAPEAQRRARRSLADDKPAVRATKSSRSRA